MPGNDCQLLACPCRSRCGVVKAFDDVGGVAIRHHTFRVLAAAVFVIGDLPQRGYRIHGSSVPDAHSSWPSMNPARITPKPPISAAMSRAIPTSVPRSVFSNWLSVSRRTP